MKRERLRVLFVCTGNAGRSQMARVLSEQRGGAEVYARSAGVEPWENLHPMAVKLMADRGLDISQRRPRHVRDAMGEVFDVVVAIGEPARKQIPRPMPGSARIVEWDISDPADADGTDQSEAVFRQTLARIEPQVDALVDQMLERALPSRVGMKPGLTTGMWYPEVFEPAVHLPQAVEAGFAAIELNCFLGPQHFDYHDPQRRRELARVCDDLGIEVWSIHDPRNTHAPGAFDPKSHQSAMDDLRRSIDLAAEFGAQAIPTHALVHHTYKNAAVADLARGVEALHTLTPQLRAAGTRLAIENTYSGALDVLRLLDELPADAFGYVIDTGHAHMEGVGTSDAVFDAAGGRMCTLHLNDNDGSKDSHHPPGGGTIDWSRIADGVRRSGYDGCLLWEVFAQLGDRCDDRVEVMRQTIEQSKAFFGEP